MTTNRSFQFFPGATAAMLLGVAILAALGTWQLHRRAWKMALVEAVTARVDGVPADLATVMRAYLAGEDPEYTPVATRGRFEPSAEFHVFGTIGPRPGYFIFTRFIPAGGEGASAPFFVNRGFVPQDQRAQMTAASADPTTLTGLFRKAERKPLFARWLTPPHQPDANIWYARDPALFQPPSQDDGTRDRSPVETGWYLDSLARSETPGTYPQGGNTRIEFNNRHLEYALTWYGLGLTLIGVWLAFSFRRQ